MKLEQPKPFLKWVGGKRQVLDQYKLLFPNEYENYYEPFLGGGAVFYHLLPNNAYLNDINKKLINTYRFVKKSIDDLVDLLRVIEMEYLNLDIEHRKEYYYNKRDIFNSNIRGVEQAALFIFLNRTGFNGMYRENSKGMFNIPQGRYKNPKILDEENLRNVSESLQNVTLTSIGFTEALKSAEKGDFVYLDPPYYPLTQTSSFTSYSKDDFTEKDQMDLRNVYVELNARGCKIMLSNSSADFIKELYSDFKQIEIKAKRSINSKAKKRGMIKELAIINY